MRAGPSRQGSRARPPGRSVLLLPFAVLLGAACSPGGRGLEAAGVPPDAGALDAGAGPDGHADGGGDRATDAGDTPAEDGTLLSYTHVGTYPREVIEPFLSPGVEIDNGYSVYTIRFATDGAESLGTVTIPADDGLAPPPRGFDVAVNAHGTIGIEDPCALAGTISGAGLAGLFGARGMIGVAPDYPGLGTPGLHPYLVARSEGAAVLDSIRAALALSRELGVATSGRAAVAGLSQGGHAAIAAAALHAAYAPDLDVRAFAAAAPAAVWESHWRAGVAFDGEHLALHAMFVYAWRARYTWPDLPLFAPALASRIDRLMAERCLWSPTGASIPLFQGAFPTTAEEVFDPAFLAEYSSGRWSAYDFVKDAFTENAIGPYVQTAPLRIWQGDADLVVPEPLTRELVEALVSGGVDVEYTVVPGGTHLDVAFGFVASRELRTEESLAWIEAELATP